MIMEVYKTDEQDFSVGHLKQSTEFKGKGKLSSDLLHVHVCSDNE